MPIYALGDTAPRLPAEGDYWIAPDAIAIGDVVMHPGSSLWFGVVARADNDTITIGENSNVQERCVLHVDPGEPLTIGRNVTVGHMAMLHGCTIGDNSLIGIGAIVMGRAVIGKNCLIGAGSLITEGKVIPDNSVVMGAPGKVVKEVGPGQEAALTMSAQSYVQNWKRMVRELKPA